MKALLLLLTLLLGGSAFAQSSARFTITRSVIAGGGATPSTGSRFQLDSTGGQSLAAVPSSTRFTLQGGFWIKLAPIIFAPAKTGNDFQISFQTEAGKTYTPQYVDDLSNLNWQNLPVVTGDGTVKTVINTAPGITQRLFRLIEQ